LSVFEPGRVTPMPSLVEAARRVREHAYASYSGFTVGAAIETADGAVITGCNVENASYGLTMCAERVAVFTAVASGYRAFVRLAVVADRDGGVTPCGACRQVLWELAGDIEVVVGGLSGEVTVYRLADLLPHAFDAVRPKPGLR
jgi:cytidine deaminase